MNYEVLMKQCLNLAKQSEGKVSPNPLVGCVVLNKENEIISTGYHAEYGKNHAERDALLKLKNGEENGGTLVVNLEPCSHYGKTPPCTDLIIERGIKKVVIGMRDVNPKVDGIKKLKAAGIEVVENVLEDECKKLNEIFIKNMRENKPFIAIKTATTLDGKIATSNGSSKWITSEKAREEVKKIRNRYDAILTTSSTIVADNPSMEHKNKIILDRESRTNKTDKIYKSGKIFLFNKENCPVINEKLDLEYIFNKVYEQGIKSILIEAGGHLNGEALKYTDKIYHFVAPKITGDNNSLSCFDFRQINSINDSMNFKFDNIEMFKPDILLTYYQTNKSF